MGIVSNIQGLAGSIGYMTLTYFMPLILGYALLAAPVDMTTRMLTQGPAFLSLVVCMALAVVGIWYGFQELVDSATNGETLECHMFMNETDVEDACIAAIGEHSSTILHSASTIHGV